MHQLYEYLPVAIRQDEGRAGLQSLQDGKEDAFNVVLEVRFVRILWRTQARHLDRRVRKGLHDYDEFGETLRVIFQLDSANRVVHTAILAAMRNNLLAKRRTVQRAYDAVTECGHHPRTVVERPVWVQAV